MATKAKVVFRPESRLPTLNDLSLGNRATKYNDLTWAKACAAKGITKVVFDRNGYVYQAMNRVGVRADSARQAGLRF